MDHPLILLIAQILSILIGIISFRKKSVNTSGLVALLLISTYLIWFQLLHFLCILFYMFASSSLLSRYKKSEKKDLDVLIKTGPRDYKQALANLGIAVLFSILYYFTSSDIFIAGFTGSVAAANADSWASELGMLSKRQPVLITNFKPVQRGISGGITLEGILAGVAGSTFIAASSLATFYLSDISGNLWLLFWTSLLAGIAGCLLDSYIGAVLQGLYKNKKKQLTENTSDDIILIKGKSWIDNDVVNLFTSIAGGILAGTLYFLFL